MYLSNHMLLRWTPSYALEAIDEIILPLKAYEPKLFFEDIVQLNMDHA